MKSTYGTSSSLLERVKADETGAWEMLCQIYTPLVYSWSRQAGLQEPDAEDLCQETFQSIARHIKSFRREQPKDSFRGWLWVIHRNHLRKWFRERVGQEEAQGGSVARAQLERIPDWIEQESNQTEPELGPAEEAALLRRALKLVEADFLPATWTAFWRFAVEGFTSKEVAASLGISEAAVRQAKFRVLSRLREVLE
jgi:RNA polymerase sigma-70 factor (ECF subfamily)